MAEKQEVKKTILTLSIWADTIEAVKQAAKDDRMSLSAWTESLYLKELKKRGSDGKK